MNCFLYTKKGSRKHLLAHQFTGNNVSMTSLFLEQTNHEFNCRPVGYFYEYDIPTKNGLETVTHGNWIVQNKDGELEVYTPIEFAAMFTHTGKQITLE